MKFAFVSTMASVPWGGSEILWSAASKRLAIDGHQVFVRYPWWPTLPDPLRMLASDFKVEIALYGMRRSFTQRLTGQVLRSLRATPFMDSERKMASQCPTRNPLHFERERD